MESRVEWLSLRIKVNSTKLSVRMFECASLTLTSHWQSQWQSVTSTSRLTILCCYALSGVSAICSVALTIKASGCDGQLLQHSSDTKVFSKTENIQNSMNKCLVLYGKVQVELFFIADWVVIYCKEKPFTHRKYIIWPPVENYSPLAMRENAHLLFIARIYPPSELMHFVTYPSSAIVKPTFRTKEHFPLQQYLILPMQG